MSSLETNTHSFVIRIWREGAEGRPGTWRGHITHVLSGKRSYLKDLGDILTFIVPYLKEMGVEVTRLPPDL